MKEEKKKRQWLQLLILFLLLFVIFRPEPEAPPQKVIHTTKYVTVKKEEPVAVVMAQSLKEEVLPQAPISIPQYTKPKPEKKLRIVEVTPVYSGSNAGHTIVGFLRPGTQVPVNNGDKLLFEKSMWIPVHVDGIEGHVFVGRR